MSSSQPCPAQTAELECLQTRSLNPGSVIYTSFPCLYSHLHISSSWRFCALIFSPLSVPAPAARGALAPWQTSAAAVQKCWGRCSIPEIFSSRMRAFPSRMRAFHAAKLAPHLSAHVSLSPKGLSAGFICRVYLAGCKVLFGCSPAQSPPEHGGLSAGQQAAEHGMLIPG